MTGRRMSQYMDVTGSFNDMFDIINNHCIYSFVSHILFDACSIKKCLLSNDCFYRVNTEPAQCSHSCLQGKSDSARSYVLTLEETPLYMLRLYQFHSAQYCLPSSPLVAKFLQLPFTHVSLIPRCTIHHYV